MSLWGTSVSLKFVQINKSSELFLKNTGECYCMFINIYVVVKGEGGVGSMW
jgi:hypothetical protein